MTFADLKTKALDRLIYLVVAAVVRGFGQAYRGCSQITSDIQTKWETFGVIAEYMGTHEGLTTEEMAALQALIERAKAEGRIP